MKTILLASVISVVGSSALAAPTVLKHLECLNQHMALSIDVTNDYQEVALVSWTMNWTRKGQPVSQTNLGMLQSTAGDVKNFSSSDKSSTLVVVTKQNTVTAIVDQKYNFICQ